MMDKMFSTTLERSGCLCHRLNAKKTEKKNAREAAFFIFEKKKKMTKKKKKKKKKWKNSPCSTFTVSYHVKCEEEEEDESEMQTGREASRGE